jgi:hypothetical protein
VSLTTPSGQPALGINALSPEVYAMVGNDTKMIAVRSCTYMDEISLRSTGFFLLLESSNQILCNSRVHGAGQVDDDVDYMPLISRGQRSMERLLLPLWRIIVSTTLVSSLRSRRMALAPEACNASTCSFDRTEAMMFDSERRLSLLDMKSATIEPPLGGN